MALETTSTTASLAATILARRALGAAGPALIGGVDGRIPGASCSRRDVEGVWNVGIVALGAMRPMLHGNGNDDPQRWTSPPPNRCPRALKQTDVESTTIGSEARLASALREWTSRGEEKVEDKSKSGWQ